MRCPYCGSRLGKEPEAFCSYCGEKLPPMQGAVLEKRSINRNTGSRSQERALQKRKDERAVPARKKRRRESTLGAVLIVLLALALFAGIVWVLFGDGMATVAPYLEQAGIILENAR